MLKYNPIFVYFFYLLLSGISAGEFDSEPDNDIENDGDWPNVRTYALVFHTTTEKNLYNEITGHLLSKVLLDSQKSEQTDNEPLTIRVLRRLGLPLPEDVNDDRPLKIRDLKVLGFNLPHQINALNDSLTIDDLKNLGLPWNSKIFGSDRRVTAEDLKKLGFDWMTDLLLSKNRKLVLSDLKKLGIHLPNDVNPNNILTMKDLEAISKKRPLPVELYGIKNLADVRRAVEKAERPLIDLLVTLGFLDPLDAKAINGRRADDVKPQFVIPEPDCKFKKEYKRECIGNVSSYCKYDMSRYLLPTPSKIRNWCCGINEKINCAVKWLTSCDSPIETTDYTHGKSFIMEQFCNNRVRIKMYSELGACHDRLKTEWNYCYREFENHLLTLYDMINYNELHPNDSISFCCARARFRGCVTQVLISETKMYTKNNSYCTSENIDALKQFTLVFSNGLSFRTCDFTFKISDCHYIDGPFSLTMKDLSYNAAVILCSKLEMISMLLYWSICSMFL